jgi:hypothetical protein
MLDGGGFVPSYKIRDQSKPFKTEVPGAVFHGGTGFALAMLPVVRLSVGAGESARGAIVHVAEKDEAATSAALARIHPLILARRPRTFGLSVHSDELSFADVLAAAAKTGDACKKSAPVAVTLRMLFVLDGGARVQSDAFPGLLAACPVTLPPALRDGHGAAVKGFWDNDWHLFSCHSEWRWDGAALRWFTVCRGACDPGDPPCHIWMDAPKRAAWGLKFCDCL